MSPGWQTKLADYCQQQQYPAPFYNIISDRRAGRTAWSATVTVSSPQTHVPQTIQARFWYDGRHIENAKEDVAEVALRTFNNPTNPSEPS